MPFIRRALLVFAACAAPALAENPFDPPKDFEPDIRFWTRIYTEVGTDGGLLHDDRYLGVVYETLKFPEDMSPKERSRRVTVAKEHYQAILRGFSLGGSADGSEEKRVRALWPENTSSRMFAEAIARVRFQLGQADRFREGLIRSGAYEAHIAETLANMGLPAELAALPHVESSFDPAAYSKAGAAGLWQFMRSTGRRYMRIDGIVDERMDPYRSSIAAAQLLEFNHSLLGTWPLAITAYNHGAAGMRRAKERQGTDDIVTIVRKHSSRTFGFASRNYYIAFLAALEVDRNAEKYFGALERRTEAKTRSVQLPAFMPVSTLERELALEVSALRALNPSLTASVWSGDFYVPKNFELRVPELTFAQVNPALKFVNLAPPDAYDAQRRSLTHRVGAGESLSAIARRYGTSVSALMQMNSLRSANSIRRGQVLKLPGAAPAAPVAAAVAGATPAEKAAPAPGPIYVVRRGDSLSEIAKRVGLSESELMTLNRINDRNFVYEGQRLHISGATAAPEHPGEPPGSAEPLPGEIVTVTVLADAHVTAQEEEAEAEQAIARTQTSEPVSEAQAEAIGPTLVPGAQSAVSADPSDYSVADDKTIEVQAAETLGHYAEWLGVRASRLRDLNNMRFDRPVVIGRRLKLDFSQVSADAFEERRRDYHQRLQEEFFAGNRIVGTEVHVVRSGESLWVIAQKYQNVPIWLLRQYNPDVDFGDVRPRTQLVMPKVQSATAPQPGGAGDT
jgi:membrane-bound lytic murein transglycosylase D